MALLLAGCSAGSPEPQAEVGLDIALPVSTPEPKPASGGVVRMYMPANADITDPLKVNTEEMLGFFSLIYESLISISPDGRLTAELAENWASEDGGRTWRVNLRSDVKWHGTQQRLSAHDVAATFERLQLLGEDSYYAFCLDKISSIEAVNNTTLTVSMKEGGYASLYALTFPVLMNGAASYVPTGTGPYMAKGFDGEGYELAANEGWWKQRPYIDSFIFYERDSNDTALASYSAGQLDFVPTSSATAGTYRQEPDTTVRDVMTQSVEIMLINSHSSALSDVRVRQAIAYALDRGKVISNIYMNRARACDVPIAPDSWLYDTKSKVYDYNLTQAAALMAEAGWEDVDGDGMLEYGGLPLSEMSLQLLVNDSLDGARRSAASAIAEQLVELGISVEVITAPYSMAESNSQYLRMLLNGEYDIALIGLNLGRDADLTEVLAQGGAANYGNYYDGELYELSRRIITAGDEASYRAAAQAFQGKFVEKMPFIVLYFRLNSIICSSEIKGLTDEREPDIMRAVEKWYIYTTDGLQ